MEIKQFAPKRLNGVEKILFGGAVVGTVAAVTGKVLPVLTEAYEPGDTISDYGCKVGAIAASAFIGYWAGRTHERRKNNIRD